MKIATHVAPLLAAAAATIGILSGAVARPMVSAEMLAHGAHLKNYNGVITEEVARQRLRKLGYEAVTPAKVGVMRDYRRGTASQVIGVAPFELTAQKNGQTHKIEFDRVTGEMHEAP